MAVRIITDSASDIPFERQDELGITIMSVPVFFGDKEYSGNGDLDNDNFYEMLAKTSAPPKTAQVNPYRIEEECSKWLKKGDEVLCMFMSSELSGTHQSAILARNMLDDGKIFIVDTKNITFGLTLMVREAIRLRDEGMCAGDICERMNELKRRVRLFAYVDTLKYLKMGGRISGAAALVGTLLGIKPLIQVFEGKVLPLTKAKGSAKAIQEIFSFIKKHPIDTSFGVVTGHSRSFDALAQFNKNIQEQFGAKILDSCELGPVLGTHVGPGALGLAYFEKID